MKKVFVTMVADLFHHGHVAFLERAREHGDYLVVGVLSEAMAERYKRKPVLSLEQRIRVVAACRHVDEVIEHASPVTNQWLVANNFAAKVLAVGNEWDRDRIARKDTGLEPRFKIEVAYEPGISTTDIIRQFRER